MKSAILKLLGRKPPTPPVRDLSTVMYLYDDISRHKYKYGPYRMCVYTTGRMKVMYAGYNLTEHDVRTIHAISKKRPCYINTPTGVITTQYGENLPPVL